MKIIWFNGKTSHIKISFILIVMFMLASPFILSATLGDSPTPIELPKKELPKENNVQVVKLQMQKTVLRVIKEDKDIPVDNLSIVNKTHYCFNTKINSTAIISKYSKPEIYKFRKEEITETKKVLVKDKLIDIKTLNFSKAIPISFDTKKICSKLVLGIDSYGVNTTQIEVLNISVGVFNNTKLPERKIFTAINDSDLFLYLTFDDTLTGDNPVRGHGILNANYVQEWTASNIISENCLKNSCFNGSSIDTNQDRLNIQDLDTLNNFNNLNEYTVLARVYSDNYQGDDTIYHLNTSNMGRFFGATFRCYHGGVSDVVGMDEIETAYFVVCRVNGTHVEAFVDGVSSGSPTPIGNLVTKVGNEFVVGGQISGGYFDGTIDEFMFFNRSLSDEEILAFNNSELLNFPNNGTYTSQVISLNASYNRTNVTLDTTSIKGLNVDGKVRTKNFTWINKLLLYYDFDSDETIATDLMSNYDGTLINNAGITSSGKFDRGVTFDGADDVIETNWYPNPCDNSTTSYWINLSTNTISLSGAHDAGNRRYYSGFDWDGVNFEIFYGAGDSYTNTVDLSLSLNTWYHVVVTYDGTLARYYLNGTNLNNLTYVCGGESTLTYIVGAQHLGASNYDGDVNGIMDEFMFFNRTLNSTEIQEIYDWTAWGKYTSSQSFPNGVSTNKYNISPDAEFEQYRFNLYSNGTDSTTINSINSTSFNELAGAVADTTPPVITIVNPANATNLSNSTTWTWINITTNENANCRYNITNSNFTVMTSFTTTGITSHSFNKSGLTNGSTYDAYYKCNDSSGNINTVPTFHVFYTNQTPITDTTPPIYSTPLTNESTTNQSSDVTWANDENTNYSLSYGICPTYTGTAHTNISFSTSHRDSMTGLLNLTNICVNTTVWDSSGNSNSSHFNFTTDVFIPIVPSVNIGYINDSCVLDRSCCESIVNSLDFVCFRNDTNSSFSNPFEPKDLYGNNSEYAFMGYEGSKFAMKGDDINNYNGWSGIGRVKFGGSSVMSNQFLIVPQDTDKIRNNVWGVLSNGNSDSGSHQRSETYAVPINEWSFIVYTKIRCLDADHCTVAEDDAVWMEHDSNMNYSIINSTNLINGTYYGLRLNFTIPSGNSYERAGLLTEWIIAFNDTPDQIYNSSLTKKKFRWDINNGENITIVSIITIKEYENNISEWLENPIKTINDAINFTTEWNRNLKYPLHLNDSEKESYYFGGLNYRMNTIKTHPRNENVSPWGNRRVYAPTMSTYPATWIWDSFISCIGMIQACKSDSVDCIQICKENLQVWINHSESNPDTIWQRSLRDNNASEAGSQPTGGWDLVTLHLYNRTSISKDYLCNKAYPSLKNHYVGKNSTALVQISSTEWCIDVSAGDAGWDGSVRYDGKCQIDSTGWQALSAESLATIAGICGNDTAKQNFKTEFNYLQNGLKAMWSNTEDDFCDINSSDECLYYNNNITSPAISVASAWAILANITNTSQNKKILNNWDNASRLGTYNPIPTLIKTHEKYDPAGSVENWMGDVWAPPNIIAILALTNQGLTKNVSDIKNRSVDMVSESAVIGCEAYMSDNYTCAPVFSAPAKLAYIWGDSLLYTATWGLDLMSIINLSISAASTTPTIDKSLVINLTFDNESNPWKDYSSYAHIFNQVGTLNRSNKTYCKWYGCLNLTFGEGNYLNSTSKFNLNKSGFASSYWLYYRTEVDSSGLASGHWQIGLQGDGDAIGVFENNNNYGVSIMIHNSSGSIQTLSDNTDESISGTWLHFFVQFNPTTNEVLTYVGAVLMENDTYTNGDIADVLGKQIFIGEGRYASAPDAYIDEFLLYNRSNFTLSDIQEIYDEKSFGTPPTLDLYIKSIKYELPYNWSHDNNTIITGGYMDINFTIANAGTSNTDNFIYNFSIDDINVCGGNISILAKSETNITCNWTTSYGFKKGNITLDVNDNVLEDDETNNYFKVYIPFMDRPWFHFNLSSYFANKPYCENSSNTVAYTSCDWVRTFGAMGDFNDAYTGDSVDPYGANLRQASMGCMHEGYTEASGVCGIARRHLFGWANRSLTSYTSVQAYHQLIHVGIGYDIMFPNLTKSENELLSQQLHDICQRITNDDSTRPDLDDDDSIKGGNGFGFGSGIGGFCYTLLGSYKEDPALIREDNQQYGGENIADEWMDREISFLRSYKNQSNSLYQEGWGYATYAFPHLADNFYFRNRFGLIDMGKYNNSLCSMATEYIFSYTDTNYDGIKLRNDEGYNFRGIQRGDTNSYQKIDDSLFTDWGTPLLLAYACGDKDIKKSILWLRDMASDVGDSTKDYLSPYVYKEIVDQIGDSEKLSPDRTMSKFIFDNADDIFYLRSNFTYKNDTIIQIDGGEERGGGHSQAQGYYLYALGEPFLDYEQVPFEDDTRMDVWKNGISFQNTTQIVEGSGGQWKNTQGQYAYNQYYGSNDQTASFLTDYPNYRIFSLAYGGDLEDYIGTKDADFAGVFSWRPYFNATKPVEEYFIKFGDLLAKRTIVSGNDEGEVFHNFINIYNEFGETRDGTNITLNRTRWDNKSVYLDINTIYTNETLTIGGGETNITYCFAKTSCSGSSRGNSTYRRTYLHSVKPDIDFILAHHWYYDGAQVNQTSIGNNDKGLNQSGNVIIFDTDNDKQINYTNINCSGWGLVYNESTDKTGAFNTTYIKKNNLVLFSSNDSTSVFIEEGTNEIKVTLNTMQRDPYIDIPKTVEVTIDADMLTNNSNFTVKKSGIDLVTSSEIGTLVTFEVETDQNSDYYIITAGLENDTTAPTLSAYTNSSRTNISTVITINANEAINYSLLIYNSSTRISANLINTTESNSFTSSRTINITNLLNSTTYYVNGTFWDSSGNVLRDDSLNFTTESYTPLLIPPVITISNPTATTYATSYLDLNFSADETVDWCAYSLDEGANNTALYSSIVKKETSSSMVCGANWSPVGNICNNTDDGNYGSFGSPDVFQSAEVWYNFTKEDGSVSSSVLQTRFGINSASPTINDTNMSISQSCWDYDTDKVVFRMFSVFVGGNNDTVSVYCKNSTGWDFMFTNPDRAGPFGRSHQIYEVAMQFNISQTPHNITLKGLSEGGHNVSIFCNDTNGNMGQSSVTSFTTDYTRPSTNINNISRSNISLNIQVNCSESCNISIDIYNSTNRTTNNLITTFTNASFSLSHKYNFTNLTNSTIHYFNVTTWDALGNQAINNTFNSTTYFYTRTIVDEDSDTSGSNDDAIDSPENPASPFYSDVINDTVTFIKQKVSPENMKEFIINVAKNPKNFFEEWKNLTRVEQTIYIVLAILMILFITFMVWFLSTSKKKKKNVKKHQEDIFN